MIINISGLSKLFGTSNSMQHEVKKHIEKSLASYFSKSDHENDSHSEDIKKDDTAKYPDNNVNITVHFSEDSPSFSKCEIIINRGAGAKTIINASASDKDIFHAFNLTLARIKTQLRKYRKKLAKHHTDKEDLQEALINATKYIIPSSENTQDEEEDYDNNPVIITEKQTHISYLSVKEAVMRMDLLNLPALMFKNRANGRMNLVYYRKDGNISWIDPKESA